MDSETVQRLKKHKTRTGRKRYAFINACDLISYQMLAVVFKVPLKQTEYKYTNGSSKVIMCTLLPVQSFNGALVK